MRWIPLPAATTRSGVLEVYERHSRGLITLTELRGLDPKGFGLWGWALGRQGVGCAAGSPRGRWVLKYWALGALGRRRRGLRTGYFARSLCTLSRSTPHVGVAIRRGSFFWALGVGRWVRGRVTPGALGRRRGHFAGTSVARLEAPIEHSTTVWSASL
jgi:hypothetical protein